MKKYFITFTYGFLKWLGRIPIEDKKGRIIYFKSKNQAEKYSRIDIYGNGFFNYYSKVERIE